MMSRCLGGNVYLGSRTAQDRLLLECLGPAIQELQDRGLARGFWFDRFDARGPHVFFLTRPVADLDALREPLTRWLEAYLATSADPEEIPLAEIEERHRQVMGRTMCSADELPGLAEGRSFILFEHADGRFPVRLGEHLEEPLEFWGIWEDLSLWSLRQIAVGGAESIRTTGIRWAAALDRALRKAGVARAFWQYHAETLLPGIVAGQPEREKQRIFAYLASAGGAQNRDAFARLWKEAETSPPPWPPMQRLIDTALAVKPPGERFAVLREVVHCTWKQLGIPVHQEIPVVLFAWGRSVSLS